MIIMHKTNTSKNWW